MISDNKLVNEILTEVGARLGRDLISECGILLQEEDCSVRLRALLEESLAADAIMRYEASVGNAISYHDAREHYLSKQLKADKPDDGPWPPWVVLWDVYSKMRSVKGKELVEFVEYQTRTIDQISKADNDTSMALEMEKSHILGFGMDDGKYAFDEYLLLQKESKSSALRRGGSLKTSGGKPNKLLLKAIKKGIKKASRKNIYVTIALIVASVLLWFMMGNTKQVLGFVANATEEDLYTNNWQGGSDSGVYMNKGKMTSYMTGYFPPDYDKNLAIPYSYIDEDDLNESAVWCGGFFMEKDFGFYGAEGFFVLSDEEKKLNVVTLGACPYSADNRTWIQGLDDLSAIDSKDKKSKLYREMYDQNEITHTEEFGIFNLYTCLGSKKGDSESGGETAMVVSIEDSTLVAKSEFPS